MKIGDRVRKKLANLCRRLERKIHATVYPIEYFGYVHLGTFKLSEHYVQNLGKWTTSEKERAPFYRHNREADRLACIFRKWAFKLEFGK